MKRDFYTRGYWKLLLLVTFLSTGLIWACSRNAVEVAPSQAAELTAKSKSGLDYQQYQGQVAIQYYNQSAILVRFQPSNSDTVSRIFVFQTRTPLKSTFATVFSNARIISFPHALFIKDLESVQEKSYEFVVDSEHSRASSNQLKNDLNINVGWSFTGVGLAMQISKWTNLPNKFSYNADDENLSELFQTLLQYNLEAKGHTLSTTNSISTKFKTMSTSSTNADCASGGVGATSCSVQAGGPASCSVTCGDHYYACCNPYSCKCILIIN